VTSAGQLVLKAADCFQQQFHYTSSSAGRSERAAAKPYVERVVGGFGG
jgi:hypothetical protein